jgi:LemA protein
MRSMRNRGSAGSLVAVLVIGILALVLLVGLAVFMWYKAGYDKAVRLDETAKEAWGNVDAQLQRRFDLVPQLVETVKGIVRQEQVVFGQIAEARTKYMNAQTPEGKMQASNMLSGLLPNLLALREAYPELRSNQNFLALQDQLEGTENRISVARTRYNEAVKTLNAFARSLFGPFFCKKAGVEARAPFEASEQAKTEVPKVDFSQRPQATPEPIPATE